MAYEPTAWKDHVTNPSNAYYIDDNHDSTYTITPAGEVLQQGTAQNQENFNHMEDGIMDAHIAAALLLNGLRQNAWTVQHGTITLTNAQQYPFNDSAKSVSLDEAMESEDYTVICEAESVDGNLGEITVTDRLTNGFKLAYTGSAKSATINYTVLGGYMK
ncbi:MAG: hypothetical protein LUD25_02400 [Coriobacteriaceae bacterium]|nr:hypothetical protein [Coriobacteriaceae bacterium]